MIRRTVARAFGLSGEDRPRLERTTPAGQDSRINLLNQFFIELQAALERASIEDKRARSARTNKGSKTGTPCQVSKSHPLSEGIEFMAQGPGGSYRFLNGMAGIVWIFREEEGGFREDRLVTIHFEGKAHRAIERPAGGLRAPFRFTSVPQMVREIFSRPRQ